MSPGSALSTSAVAALAEATADALAPREAAGEPGASDDSTAGGILERYDQGKAGWEETLLELYYGGVPLASAGACASRLFGGGSGLPELLAGVEATRRDVAEWLGRPLAHAGSVLILQSATIEQRTARGGRRTEVVVAVGLASNGAREALGVAAAPGPEAWERIVGSLHRRGLPRPELVVGEHDDAARAAVGRYFPGTPYQLCLQRLEQHLQAAVSVAQVHAVMDGFAAIRAGRTRLEVEAATAALVARLREAGQAAAVDLLEQTASFRTAYLRHAPAHRQRLSHAGVVKRILSHLRSRLRALGPGLSDEALVQLVAARLRRTWPARGAAAPGDSGRAAG